MIDLKKHFSMRLLATAALLVGASSAFAAGAPSLGTVANFAVLSATPSAGGKVTCTDSIITGNVGSTGSVTQTNCSITAITAPVSTQVLTDFNAAYDALAGQSCDSFLTGTLANVTLTPGIYCFAAAAALTGTLTLNGDPNDTWLFKIGTSGTGALTGTNFSVVMAGGGQACNVTWWVADAATMTTSDFKGTILAGADITATGVAPTSLSPFEGRALAKAAVTLTNEAFTGCTGGSIGGTAKPKCNQGVGNGPEGCDPGNSNLAFPFRSNDETGGVPGNPGRKGGKK
jgi:hypothetical protein